MTTNVQPFDFQIPQPGPQFYAELTRDLKGILKGLAGGIAAIIEENIEKEIREFQENDILAAASDTGKALAQLSSTTSQGGTHSH